MLISTKLNRPATMGRCVPRPRLLAHLDEGLEKRVTLISAPAGSGKTTLAAQWLEQNPALSAWLSIGGDEGDLERFLRYVIAALRTAVSGICEEVEILLTAVQLPSPERLADVMVAELTALTRPLVLVLDDYHTLSSEPVQKVLIRMVEQLPDSLHLVILTRVDPPWPLGRWRAQRWLNEVRAADLSFTDEETRGLFRDQPLTDETIRILHSRTEGWVAALQLTRLSLADHKHPEEFVRDLSGSDRLVADYLMDEVVSHLSPEVMDFFAVTALLDRFCAPLCDFLLADVCHGQESRQLIAFIERENLFLVPLDNERGWYRYHHLFQSLLTHELKARLSSERKAFLFRRAAEWFAREGLVEEGLRYYIAAGDISTAAELLDANTEATLDKDLSRRTLGRWLAIFPESATKQQPALLVAHAWRKITRWDVPGLGSLLDDADALLRDPACTIPEPRRKTLLADVDAQRAFCLYWQGDAEGALESALRSMAAGPSQRGPARDLAIIYAAGSYATTGRLGEALRLLADVLAEDCARGSRRAGAFLVAQAAIHSYSGDLGAVWQAASQMLSIHEGVPVPDYYRGYAHYFLGVVAYERNLLDTAADEFRRVEKLRYAVNTRLYHDSLLGSALAAWAKGETEKARAYADSARSFAVEASDASSLKLSGSFDLRLDVLSNARIGELAPYSPTVDSNQFWLEIPSLTRAEFLVHRAAPGDCEAALQILEDALKQAEHHHNTRQAFQLRAVKALAMKGAGKARAARRLLEKTLRMAQPFGLIRTFVDRGPRMAEMLKSLLKTSPQDPYLLDLLSVFAGETAPRDRADGEEPLGGLSNRELDVLALLGQRLSNKEIAGRLHISPHTVKKHTVSIYAKLGVNKRTQAVAVARSRGLLPSI